MAIDWKKIGESLANSAPILGAALGGPAGASVGAMVAATLGTKADPDSVLNAINGAPSEALLRLRELEANTQIELQKLMVQAAAKELEAKQQAKETEVDDRKSARSFAVKDPNNKIRPFIAAGLLLGVMFVVAAIFSASGREVMTDAGSISVISLVAGMLFGELKSVISFYFGSSSDSEQLSSDFQKSVKEFKK